MSDDPEVRLRVLTAPDAEWVTAVDRDAATNLARQFGWSPEELETQLANGEWATDQQMGWAIVIDGQPGGFALVAMDDSGDGQMDIRVARGHRGKGVGREVLRQLADHHFASNPGLKRLAGRTHEQNLPMQRAFTAAGFRMEARYRASFEQPDGKLASEWGYALTRSDWEEDRHREGGRGFNFHGLTFTAERVGVAEEEQRPSDDPVAFKFLQDGRRILGKYSGPRIHDGELAGILVNDLVIYRYVHDEDGLDEVATGSGRARVQRRQDGRLELINSWAGDDGRHGTSYLLERR